MANVKGLIIAGITVVAAVGVYYGLNMTMPHVEEKGVLPATASLDQVYSGTISQAEPAPGAPAPATAADAPTPPPTAVTPAPAEAKPATPAPQAPSEQAKAEPASPPPAPAPQAAEPAPPPKPAEAAAKPAEQPMLVPEPAAQTAAPPPKAEPKAEPKKAEPKAQPKAEPKAEPKTEPKAEAKAEPATPKPAAKLPAAASSASAGTRWWGDPAHQNPQQLNLSFAGQAAGEKAIALMFTGTFTNPGVANKIKVLKDGHTANGHWELSPNPRMILFRGIGAGRYTVVLAPDLKDSQGKALGRKLSGPVDVQ